MIGGHLNAPRSSRLLTNIIPLPSQNRSFTRSARLARNTRIVPENGPRLGFRGPAPTPAGTGDHLDPTKLFRLVATKYRLR
jgi:hypothetical protein